MHLDKTFVHQSIGPKKKKIFSDKGGNVGASASCGHISSYILALYDGVNPSVQGHSLYKGGYGYVGI